MHDSTFSQESANDFAENASAQQPEELSADDAPQFGAVDIVEAFTAMRHEWRSQTKETRGLAELIQAVAENFQTLEEKLLAQVEDNRLDDSSASKQLVQQLVETDQQLTRAIAGIAHWEANRQQGEELRENAIASYFAGMNALGRWFAWPLLNLMNSQRTPTTLPAENPAVAGLNLVLARLRRALAEHDIERFDTEGLPFDAEIMRAIGTVADADCPSGHVAEQLSPGYLWQDRILRFADVRVAK